MVKLSTLTGCLVFLNYLCCCLFLDNPGKTQHITPNIQNKNFYETTNTINTVTLTQKGYIQFLRYVKKVPPIREFTFCIWIKSNNLTYPHPLLSYSKNSKTRLIRVWISPKGRDINLAILEFPVFSVPLHFQENQWYHICISWDGHQGFWVLFVNGRIEKRGIYNKLRNSVIPGGGDLVVGQEFTDADKGLDDGIEGTIYGFNMILSSAVVLYRNPSPHSLFRALYEPRLHQTEGDIEDFNHPLGNEKVIELLPEVDYPSSFVHPLMVQHVSVSSSGFPSAAVESGDVNAFTTQTSEKLRYGEINNGKVEFSSFPPARPAEHFVPLRAEKSLTEIKKPPGYRLVELGFNHCTLGRGAPLRGDVLFISWTRTPVRVFGGAILKKVPPFCENVAVLR